jgi:hypothetical protein
VAVARRGFFASVTATIGALAIAACSSSSSSGSDACNNAWTGNYVLSMGCGTYDTGPSCTICPGAASVLISVSPNAVTQGSVHTSTATVTDAPIVTSAETGGPGFNPTTATCKATLSCCENQPGAAPTCIAGTQSVFVDCSEADMHLSGATDEETFTLALDANGQIVSATMGPTSSLVYALEATEGLPATICTWFPTGMRSE